MPVEVITPKHKVTKESYARNYDWCDDIDGGFSFDSDSEGNVFMDKLEPLALENYKDCVKHSERFEMNWYVATYEHSYWENATVKCSCGKVFEGGQACPNCGILVDEWGRHVNYLDRQGWEAMGGESYCGERWDED